MKRKRKSVSCTSVIVSPKGNLVCNCDGKGKKRAKQLDKYLARRGL